MAAAAVVAASPVFAQSDPWSFCDDADGSLASCPCSNPGLPDTGCDNAQATGGVKLDWIPETFDVRGGTIDLIGTGFNPNAQVSVILFRSDMPATPAVFGDGVLCLQTRVDRLHAYFSHAVNGQWPAPNHPSTNWPSPAGAPQLYQDQNGTRYYQLYYRNTPSSYCDAKSDFNLSNGLAIPW